MNKQEMNQHCTMMAEQLNNLYPDQLFLGDWDASPWGHTVFFHNFAKLEDGSMGDYNGRIRVVDGAKTKQAACDMAAFWIRGLSDARQGLSIN